MSLHHSLLKRITQLGLLMMMGVSMSACAISTFTWKEEVLLHDGSKIIVERTDIYESSMRHEIGQGAPLAEHITTFKIPSTNQSLIWKSDNHSSDPDELHLLALDFMNGVPYVATTPFGSNAYSKWNRPNPPYVLFKYVDGWKRISLEEFPDVFKINVITVGRKKDEPRISNAERKFGFVPAQTVTEINREPGMSKEYYSILRTPIDYGPRPADGNSSRKIRTEDGGWLGIGWFSDQPSLEACLKKCAREKVSPQDCPCNTLFKGK